MQKLSKRNTYTPTNIPHVRSNCDLGLNNSEGRNSALSLKTLDNNPDAALTATTQAGQDSRVPVVYVLNKRGEPIMPCSPRNAKTLLKNNKANVVKRTPFTIQLNYITGENKQDITLGIDSGYKNVGLSATTKNKELYSVEVILRSDIVKLNSERRMYRRTRRGRKTWYRQSRFLNRKKEKGWLAPSIQHKLDSHIKIVKKIRKILPITKMIVEVANFDIQRIKNPDICGTQYQEGEQLGFNNVREYVLHRDGHQCQHCKGKSNDKILNVHHIKSRQTGGNAPSNLITLCKTCHLNYHNGKINLKNIKIKGFKAETFMSTIRWKLFEELEKLGPTEYTYGYITKHNRINLNLSKSHVNDAFIISGGSTQKRTIEYSIKQVRKCNRKLFKGIRSHIRNTCPRFVKGFQRFDKVLYNGVECFIFGRRMRGGFALKALSGKKVNLDANVKKIKLLETSQTFLIQRRPHFLLALKGEVPMRKF